MNYATLMVHLELGQPNTGLLTLTAALADRFRASIIGIAVCQPMRIIYTEGYVPQDIIEQDREQIDRELKAAEAEFRAALAGGSATIEWRSAVTKIALSAYLATEARSTDLLITGGDRNASMFDTSRHVDIGDLVMQAGRPCLIAPPEAQKLPLEHVVVGWKDSSETRRAIRDALPLLAAAHHVTIVEIAARECLDIARARVQDVTRWLKRHGIDATSIATPETGDDATRLNEIVQELGADLLVAGAYSHSRVRECAFGGVTRDLLLRAGRCALVSH